MSDRDRIPVARPVKKEPVVTKAPPAGRKFACSSCGARLDFDPSSRGLKCPYCGFEQKIERGDSAEIAERDYADYLDREEANGRAIPGRASETRCPGCGANVLLEDNVATDKCPFCATHLDTQPEAAKAMIPPESLLPFAVDLREARNAFTAWLGSLWLAPNALRKLAEASGGRFYREEDLHTLPDRLTPAGVPVTVREEFLLWNRWSFLIVFGLLAVEWIARRLSSLS